MGKIYKGQTDLTIQLTTDKNITGATSVKIGYKDPNGAFGEFVATIKEPLTGVIEYISTDPLEVYIAGDWTIWAIIVNAEGLTSIGESSAFTVYEQGN